MILLHNMVFHKTSATGVACRQGTLTPPDTWSRPLGLAYVLLVDTNPFSELVVIFPDYALRIFLGTFSILPFKPLKIQTTYFIWHIQLYEALSNDTKADDLVTMSVTYHLHL